MHPAESLSPSNQSSLPGMIDSVFGPVLLLPLPRQRAILRPIYFSSHRIVTTHAASYSLVCDRWEFRSLAAKDQARGADQTGKAAQRKNRLVS